MVHNGSNVMREKMINLPLSISMGYLNKVLKSIRIMIDLLTIYKCFSLPKSMLKVSMYTTEQCMVDVISYPR